MGRPSKNLSKRITVRLTPEEHQRLQVDADVAAVEISTLARAQIVNAAIPRRARRKSADHQMLARVLTQLGRVGGNINQMAKVANATKDAAALRNVNWLKEEIARIRELVREALSP